MQPATPYRMTVAEYLELERNSEIRHEYHDGLVWEVDDPRRFPPRVPVRRATVAEYLAGERDSMGRHEFLNGGVFALPEPPAQHEQVLNAVATACREQLAGTGFACRVRPRVVTGTDGLITYPDLAIFDGEPRSFLSDMFSDPETVSNPVLVVDVLTSDRYDQEYIRRFDRYAVAESFREFVTIDLDDFLITQRWRRNGSWWLKDHRAPDEV